MQTTFRMPVEPDSQCLPIQISSYPESGEPPAGGLEAGSAVHIPRQGADVPHVQLPALASLSGGIKRLGGSAFSAFKPLASRQTQRPEHSNGTQVSLTLPASWVDRSGGSAASLHAEQFSKALAADTSSSSGASHRGGPSGGSDTPLPVSFQPTTWSARPASWCTGCCWLCHVVPEYAKLAALLCTE